MSAELWLYLISIFGNLREICLVGCIALGLGALIMAVLQLALVSEGNDISDTGKGIFKKILVTLCIFCTLGFLMPDEKTMYAMLATNVVKQSDIPERVLNILDAKLSEYEGKHDK